MTVTDRIVLALFRLYAIRAGDLKAHGRDSVSFYTDNKTAISRWW